MHYLIGVGMGNPDTLTIAGQNAIENSNLLIGAPRLLESYPHKDSIPLINPQEIADYIAKHSDREIAILLSGDVGFYSGAKKLYELLNEVEIQTIAGISSPVYLCAKLARPWQDLKLISAHGRDCNVLGEIQTHGETFLLTGGNYTVNILCNQLIESGLENVTLTVASRLSYPDECIETGAPSAFVGREIHPLSVVIIDNSTPMNKNAHRSMRDEEFIRGAVPMTKEEIRTLVVSKLQLSTHHIVWDVGAGTGSVSIQSALSVPKGRVYGVEKNADAILLMHQNKSKFQADNFTIVEGTAPDALDALQTPDAVFLGGTAGNMEQILRTALEKNPAVRIVVTAVTLETVAEATRVFALLNLTDVNMVQIAVTGTRQAGKYHLFQGQNPVWIFSGTGDV